MTQRIAYLTLKGAAAAGVPVADKLVSPGFEVEVVETLARVYPVDPTDLLLSDLAYVEAAMRAEQEGFDAVLIGAIPDYGLAAARAAVGIPVVGCGQASILTALGTGERFSIVTIWPETMDFVYDRVLRENSAGTRCVSVHYVSTPDEQADLVEEDNFLARMKAGREDMIARIVAEIDAAGRAGAGSVVLGCNCMSPVAATLADRTAVPLIDPTAAGYRAVESMLALGVRHRRDTRVPASARQPQLAEMLRSMATTATDEDEDCPVCVLSDDGTLSCDLPGTPAVTG